MTLRRISVPSSDAMNLSTAGVTSWRRSHERTRTPAWRYLHTRVELGFMLFFDLTLVHLGQYFTKVSGMIGHLSW